MNDYHGVFRNLKSQREMPRGAYWTKEQKNNWPEVILWIVAFSFVIPWLLYWSII